MRLHIRFFLFSFLLTLPVSILISAPKLPTPTKLQMQWQRMETNAFIHFSINTFTDQEWGFGNESPSLFNPTEVDCEQWATTLKRAGIKGVILTAKHHDGFCLWPSKYTEHSVKNSPWRNGKGDLVGEFTAACRKHGLKVGLYLSPWDCNHTAYGQPEYIDYFRNQLTELLTQYGDIFEIWFDGANGGRGYYGTDSLHRRSIAPDYYNWKQQAALVRKLQPNCVIHGGSVADIRWVGNESGYAHTTHWSTLLNKFHPEPAVRFQLNTGHKDGVRFSPSETDVSIRPGWYYHASEDHKVRTLEQMVDIYYQSVGRNSLLLLNVPPDKKGRINPIDSLRLIEWYDSYSGQLSKSLITADMVVSSSTNRGIRRLVDDNPSSYWAANSKDSEWIEIEFGKEITFNRLFLQENITQGQRIAKLKIEVFGDAGWSILDTTLTTVGYKRIARYRQTTASKLRISIMEALAPAQLTHLALYNAPLLLIAPTIRRDQYGVVTVESGDPTAAIYYTTTGESASGVGAQLYTGAFKMDNPLEVRAVVSSSDGHSSLEAVRKFGASKVDWKLVGDTLNQHLLFNDLTDKSYYTKANTNRITIDLGSQQIIEGIAYTPDQGRYPRAIVSSYRVSVSEDQQNWVTIEEDEYSNIENNPIRQQTLFSHKPQARYICFEGVQTVGGGNIIGASELEVFTSRPWRLIWSDEFDQEGDVDRSKWGFPGRKSSHWSKYASDSKQVASLKNGNLVLWARRNPNRSSSSDTSSYQTGALTTRDLFSFTYGKVEIKARFKGAKGAWPALWLMPQNNKYGGWPDSGEIDLMEHLNHDSIVYQTIHTAYTRAGNTTSESAISHGKSSIDPSGYNTYTMEWYPDSIVLMTNHKVSFVYRRDAALGSDQYPFDQPFYLIVNQALGGNWVGAIDPKELPVAIEIDYVRVYQQ